MKETPASGSGRRQPPRLVISLCKPDPEFLLDLRRSPPNSVVPITLLILISRKREEISRQVDLLRSQTERQPENTSAQQALETSLQKLNETTEQLRNDYFEWCSLQFGDVYSKLDISENHVEKNPSALSITIIGLSPEDRIKFCRHTWRMEFINRLATNDEFTKLDPDQLDDELRGIPEWTREDGNGKTSVTHVFACSNSDDASAFVSEAMRLSKLWQQEPLIDKNEHSVTITVTTPSMKGLTPENIEYASSVSTIYYRRYSY